MTTENYNDPMLENNSYYDIDMLNKSNRRVQKKINEWKEKYNNASSWLGKWYCQIQLDKLYKKLNHYENKS